MTIREIYEGVLIEINKVQAPNLLLEDFNYFLNKAIYQYANKRYNIYDINQQTTDDIMVLEVTALLPATESKTYNTVGSGYANSPYKGIYEVELPSDYFHILNCICNFKVKENFRCYNENDHVQYSAIRLTADIWSQIINNHYMKPTHKRPYFYVHNTGYNADSTITVTTKSSKRIGRALEIGGSFEVSTEDQSEAPAKMEIRYGKDSSLFKLESVYIDYLRKPQKVRLTQEQLDRIEDTSQMLEFPDYVCQEIINELVTLVMENSSDPRLQTHIPVTQSIATPAQQQEKSK